MKTYFCITIKGMGEEQVFIIQSTLLRKFDQSDKYGFYRPKNKLLFHNYHISVALALTYNIEIGSIGSKVIKQRRYKIHQVHHEVYILSQEGIYVNQPRTLCSVCVNLVEEDVIPCDCTLSIENR